MRPTSIGGPTARDTRWAGRASQAFYFMPPAPSSNALQDQFTHFPIAQSVRADFASTRILKRPQKVAAVHCVLRAKFFLFRFVTATA
jgi:hypothetical protein